MSQESSSSESAERKAKPVPPFDPLLRYTVDETSSYLKTSRMSVYKLLHAGDLEGVKEGGRTFITGRSIAARCAPPERTQWIPNPSHRTGKRQPKAKANSSAAA
jgi:excisionase family DNA binding protein